MKRPELDRQQLRFPQVITDRRRFLLGGGLVLCFGQSVLGAAFKRGRRIALDPERVALISGRGFKGFSPDAFIRISTANEIALFVPNIEMGQGIYTGQAMLIAEELEVDLEQVSVTTLQPDNEVYRQVSLQPQSTGGSTSIMENWEALRTAGALARTMLIAAAARRWSVNPSSCRAERGAVLHADSGRAVSYGALAEDAANMRKPATVKLKDPSEFKVIGKPLRRKDTAEVVNGKVVYGIDVSVPGMRVAAVMNCPVRGGKLRTVDSAGALKLDGVVQVVELRSAVAVVATHFWAAQEGLKALKIDWDFGPNATLNNTQIRTEIDRASRQATAGIAYSAGDYSKGGEAAHIRHEAVYIQPFLAHAPMEPMSAVVHLDGDGAQVWAGTQVPAAAQQSVAAALGIAPEQVVLHNQRIGGGFGRKLETDYLEQAAEIARQCEFPVKMIWSREQDTQHDRFRPMYVDRISAALDEKGLPVAWRHRIAGASIMARYSPEGVPEKGVDEDAVSQAADPVYGSLPNMQVEFAQWQTPTDFVLSWWRGVGPTRSIFVVESFIDELAHAAKRDPYQYRRELLRGQPRALAVLDAVAKASGWGKPLPSRTGRGIVVQKSFGSFLAVVIEVFVSASGEVRLRNVMAAVDCGVTINPELVKQQIEGGILFGLSAALFSEITLENGRVQQTNFHDYRSLRINESPPVEVLNLGTAHAPGGIGEVGTTAAAPALTNAIFAATGVRIRELPIRRAKLNIAT